jgi:hypothetical protein
MRRRLRVQRPMTMESGGTCNETFPTTYYVQVYATSNAPTCMNHTLIASY